jgi:hypothetical protein
MSAVSTPIFDGALCGRLVFFGDEAGADQGAADFSADGSVFGRSRGPHLRCLGGREPR